MPVLCEPSDQSVWWKLYITLVATRLGIGIDCVDIRVVALFTEGTVCAVRLKLLAICIYLQQNMTYTIESVKESVEQVGGRNLLRFIDLVINLVKSHGLGVDKGITGDISK